MIKFLMPALLSLVQFAQAYTGPLPDFVADQNNAIFDCEASPRKLLVPQLGDTGYDWACPTVADWDDDGLFDLLVGYNIQKPDSLKLVVFINQGGVGNPRFTGRPSDTTCFYITVKYPGQSFFRPFASLGAHPTAYDCAYPDCIDWHTWLGFVPSIIDWNHDGLFDILVSEGSCDLNCGCCGLVTCGNAWDRRGTWLLVNTGTRGRPVFGRAANLNYDPYNTRSPADAIPTDSFAGLSVFQQMSCDGNFPQATVVDWNSDRIPDICVAVAGADICLGDTFPNGRWKPKTNGWLSQTPADTAAFGQHPLLRSADFNNDGVNELLSCNSDVSEFLLFERNPNSSSPQYYIGPTLLYKRASGDYQKFDVADFDEDGDMDVLCGWGRTGYFAIWVYRTPGGTPGSHPYAAIEKTARNQAGGGGLSISTRPNPGSMAEISWNPAPGAAYGIEIFTVSGKQVRVYQNTPDRGVTWDGRDSRGEPVRPGIYLIRLRAGNRSCSIKHILTR